MMMCSGLTPLRLLLRRSVVAATLQLPLRYYGVLLAILVHARAGPVFLRKAVEEDYEDLLRHSVVTRCIHHLILFSSFKTHFDKNR